jgi:hypothetical protein
LGDGGSDCLVVINVVVVTIESTRNLNTVHQKGLGVGVWDRRDGQNRDRR